MERRQRILIVDDDVDTLANLSDILSDQGFDTVTAADGDRALAVVNQTCEGQSAPIDLCLLDFKMPRKDGAQVVGEIRQQLPDLPTIMITAYAGDDGAQRAHQAGTYRVMRKPVDIPTLLSTIEKALSPELAGEH